MQYISLRVRVPYLLCFAVVEGNLQGLQALELRQWQI
jgi:hypothetical protein